MLLPAEWRRPIAALLDIQLDLRLRLSHPGYPIGCEGDPAGVGSSSSTEINRLPSLTDRLPTCDPHWRKSQLWPSATSRHRPHQYKENHHARNYDLADR
jgi:hypothetical protein